MIKKLETLAAAVGMAEGGDHESALALLAELDSGLRPGHSRILTVAKDNPLNAAPVAYALGLADRMRSDALFLNILTKRFSTREASRRGDAFQAMATSVAARLWPGESPRCRRAHAVLGGNFNFLLQQACRRLHAVALVILQKRSAEPCAINIHVPVFCFDMDRTGSSKRS